MMEDSTTNNKRIAKNTLLLFGRMLLILVVSLYTSRVVLASLGIEDYGLYNVVGGIVVMFTFLNNAMANSSHRYITYALGRGDEQNLKEVVSATCLIHWAIAGVILVLAETVGLWFLHNKMVIPEDRIIASEWVYQFSIVACMVSITSIPYNAMIIAHERMGAFAVISILDAILKLSIAFLIQTFNGDKLIFYASLLLLVGIIDRILYQLYCTHNFAESKNIKLRKVPQLREMTSFAGWSMIGNLAFIGYTQGLNILLNMFFGPAVNAARGIAVQIQTAVKGFVVNFQTAVTPQIIKSYSQGDYQRLHTLVYSSSKLSFYLLYCMVLPLSLEAKTLLNIWLKEVPDYTVVFTIIVLWVMLIETLSNPIDKANQATGNIRTYQIVEGGTLLLIVPISYVALLWGGEPYMVFIIQFIVMCVVQILRLFLVCYKIKMSKREYVKKVILRVCFVAFISAVIPSVLYVILQQSFYSFFIVILVSIISVLGCSYLFGLTTSERVVVNEKVKIVVDRIKHVK